MILYTHHCLAMEFKIPDAVCVEREAPVQIFFVIKIMILKNKFPWVPGFAYKQRTISVKWIEESIQQNQHHIYNQKLLKNCVIPVSVFTGCNN